MGYPQKVIDIMILERTKNAVRNASFGIAEKVVTIVLPFIVRTVLIKKLGAEYLGLNSLFTSILSVLNMTELGFSSAIVFSMYKPIAEDDIRTINALLRFYKTIYRIIGVIIFTVGVILIPFLPKLINGTYPSDIDLTIIYLVYLLNTSISYWLFSYKSSLLTAYQRDDLISKINMVVSCVLYILQIILLLTIENYYIYVFVIPIFTVANNIGIAYITKKLFPQYIPEGNLKSEIKKDIREKINGLMIGKACSVSRNAFDSIFVSMFLGLTETAIYNNYYYISTSVTAVMIVVTNAMIGGIGNSVALESQSKNYSDLIRIDFLYMWIAGWFTCCLFCLYQPFMIIWVGESMLLPLSCVILFCIYFYALKTGDIRTMYTTTNGLWWQNRYRALLEAFSNVTLNYFLGKYLGIFGIVLATVITIVLINFLYGSQLIFKYYFTEQSKKTYFGNHLMYFGVTVINCCVVYLICFRIPNSMLFFMVKMLICTIFPNIIYWFAYNKTKVFKDAIGWLKEKTIIAKEGREK